MFTGVPFLGWVGLLAGMVSRWCADSEPRGFTFFFFRSRQRCLPVLYWERVGVLWECLGVFGAHVGMFSGGFLWDPLVPTR